MIKVGIIGGTGYTGMELLRLLAVHPAGRVAHDRLARRGGRLYTSIGRVVGRVILRATTRLWVTWPVM